jgi:hypothetical protein
VHTVVRPAHTVLVDTLHREAADTRAADVHSQVALHTAAKVVEVLSATVVVIGVMTDVMARHLAQTVVVLDQAAGTQALQARVDHQ